MQTVFLNTLEQQLEQGRVARAQVMICERQGTWQVLWDEAEQSKGQEIWFEGTSWEELLSAFRYGLAGKMGQGYVPVIDGMLENRREERGDRGLIPYLQCYGEQYANQELFEALKEWRKGKAVEQRKAAYLIATNRMLWMISAFVPHNEQELLQIPGWGAAKNEAYGADVLNRTSKVEQPVSFPLDWVVQAIEPQQFTQWLYKQKQLKLKGEMDRLQEKKLILGRVREGHTLAELQTETELPRRELIDRIEQLEQEGYDLEALIERELAEVPEEEITRIWQALAELGDRYLKPVLHHVYDEQQRKSKPVDQLYDRVRLLRLRYRRTLPHSQQAV